MLSFKLSEEFVDSYRGKPEKFGFNGLGNIVFYRTYSRVKENGEYETWTDVCARVINGMYSLLQDHARKNKRRWDSDKAQKDAQEAFDRMFNFKWTPSGRGLWMMGTPFIHERKTSEALLNCAFIGTENIKQEGGEIFEWIANMLMLGVGVAFDTKGAGEVLVSSPRNSASTYLVDDSREGWARSIKVLVNSYLDGTDVALFDYSMVRKKGEPIKGFGGVASGPEPLMLCHDRIREYMNKNVGKKITSRTITDICNAIGACVVAGNVRRSAELALGEADDQDYIALKNYSLEENKYRQEIGWASNNSIIGDGVKQYGAIAENIRNNGEPGVVWLENIEKYGRMGEEKHDNAIGVNPCQPGFATVLTPNGIRTFNDISIGDTIWSGKQWTKITNKQYTGVKDVLVYSTNAGEFIGTENHRVVQNGAKIEVKDAQEIDLAYGNVESIDLLNWQDVMDGMVIGDGMVHKASNNKVVLIIGDNDYDYFEYKSISSLITKERSGISNKAWEVKTTITADELPHTYERTVPDRFFYGDKYVVAGFLKGLFTANGCVNGYGKRIELKQTSLKLIRQVQQMLSSLGIRSYITTTKETRVVHKNGEYVSKKSYALSISVDRYKFAKLVGFVQDYKTFAVTGETAAAKNTYEINKVTNLGKMPVYDITVEADEHTYWTGGLLVSNCSEIPLASREECNLSEIYMQNMDDEYDFQRTIKFAYLYSKAITLTYEWITDSKSRKIMMKNRRVGVGTTGIAQFLGKHSVEDLVGWWDRGYKLIQSYDDRYSQWLGIPKSIRTTTIKPSGTVSLLAGATPGIHYPHDNFYIRRVRIQDDTPMLTALQYAGYKIEKDVYSANTSVIEIPIKVEGETSKNKTLWEQLQLASLAQRYWSDNSVSVTISFKPSDVTSEEIANAISLYAGELKCVSMLPITEEGQYEQMPYESITKEKYEEMIGDITPIANLAEHMSIVNKMKDLYCENDSCVIK